MFTGIIEEVGTVKDFFKTSDGANMVITAAKVLEGTKIGDSISVNGVCQTVMNLSEKTFSAQISTETLSVTNLSKVKVGEKVNLERAMTLKDRLGGHMVSGHIDGCGKLVEIVKHVEFYNLRFEAPDDIKKYLVKKGSVAINGVSLTIADITDKCFKCAIIPHTFENTNLKNLSNGSIVNLEADVLAKYIEKFLLNSQTQSIISESFLRENGFC